MRHFAYDEGYRAYQNGTGSTKNPYDPFLQEIEWELWYDGWQHAAEDE